MAAGASPFPKMVHSNSNKLLLNYYQLHYTGRPADICEHEPCVNGGTCLRSEEGFKCTCPLGYEGLNCETSKCISVILLCMCVISLTLVLFIVWLNRSSFIRLTKQVSCILRMLYLSVA